MAVVLTQSRPADLPAKVAARGIAVAGASDITVELTGAVRYGGLPAAYRDLTARAAEPNVFLEPAFVAAAEKMGVDRIRVLLAWDGKQHERLLGAWVFAEKRTAGSLWPARVLRAPLHDYAFLSTPVIDAERLDDVLTAMLDTIASDKRLPKFLALDAMGIDGPAMKAMHRVLTERGAAPVIVNRSVRPKLASPLNGKDYIEQALSGSSRKKLRQNRRRLGEHGAVNTIIHRTPADLQNALEEFLAIEAAGWKGRSGTAIVSNPRHAAFIRATIAALAEQNSARIMALRVGERAVSMQILLTSGPAAYTWKIAYDELYRQHSPGIVLLADVTAELLADPDVVVTDSCSHDDTGFMGEIWLERRELVDMLLTAYRGGSAWLPLIAAAEKLFRRTRAGGKSIFLQSKAWRTRLRRAA